MNDKPYVFTKSTSIEPLFPEVIERKLGIHEQGEWDELHEQIAKYIISTMIAEVDVIGKYEEDLHKDYDYE